MRLPWPERHPGVTGRGRPRTRVPAVALVLLAGLAVGLFAVGPWRSDVSPVRAGNVTAAVPMPVGGELHQIAVGGVTRTYRAFVPTAAHDLPLLVVLHGRGQLPSTAITVTGFVPLFQQGRAVLVYPDGVGRSWNAGGGCCGVAGSHGVGDTAFVTAVVGAAVHDLPVDPARVYLVGYSNGGKLAYTEACDHPALFAGVASYGSVPLRPCTARAALPYLLSAGALDQILPNGGAARAHPPLPPVRTAVGWLRAQDGCAPTTDGGRTSATGGPVVQRWTACRSGSDVEFVSYPRSGHPWPAGLTGLMWSFLSGHESPGPG